MKICLRITGLILFISLVILTYIKCTEREAGVDSIKTDEEEVKKPKPFKINKKN